MSTLATALSDYRSLTKETAPTVVVQNNINVLQK